MAQAVYAKPLTEAAFAPYGGVISTDIVNERTVMVNGGTARRTPEVVPTHNLYDAAPSKIPARVVLNVSLASPREVEDSSVNGVRKRVLKANVLERHKYSSQSFIPMGGNVKYLIVVTDGDKKPNLDKLNAFVAMDKQGICYGAGVWHAPMTVVDEPVSFAIVQHVNGVPDEDCEFFPLEKELEIVF